MAAMSWQFFKITTIFKSKNFYFTLSFTISCQWFLSTFWILWFLCLLRASPSCLFFPLTHLKAPILPLHPFWYKIFPTLLYYSTWPSLCFVISYISLYCIYRLFLLDSSQRPTMKCPSVYKTGYFNLLYQNTDMIKIKTIM